MPKRSGIDMVGEVEAAQRAAAKIMTKLKGTANWEAWPSTSGG